MPINETLIDSISQIVSDYKTEPIDKIFFSKIDLKYAYSQLNLNADPAKHCNCNFVSCDMTGFFQFKTGFMDSLICLTSSTKDMDYTLLSLKNVF